MSGENPQETETRQQNLQGQLDFRSWEGGLSVYVRGRMIDSQEAEPNLQQALSDKRRCAAINQSQVARACSGEEVSLLQWLVVFPLGGFW
jgi:hypothetical protein